MKRLLSLTTLILMLAFSLSTLTSCLSSLAVHREEDETTTTEQNFGYCGTISSPITTTPPTETKKPTKSYTFYEHDVEAARDCKSHGLAAIKTELIKGAGSCLDGVVTEYQCITCAYGYTMLTLNGGHPIVREELDFSELLAADGVEGHSHYGVARYCACGEINEVSVNAGYEGTQTIDGIEYKICKYKGCRLRTALTDIVYDEPDENCQADGKGVYKIFYGDELIASAPVKLGTRTFHDWEKQYALAPGATTCLGGGVLVTYDCKRCGDHFVDRPYDESMHVAEEHHIELEGLDVCDHHSIYHSLCLCETKERVFCVGFGLRERDGADGFFTCTDCDLTVTFEHDHEKVTEICETENCYKFTVRVGDQVIAEHRSPEVIILIHMN